MYDEEENANDCTLEPRSLDSVLLLSYQDTNGDQLNVEDKNQKSSLGIPMYRRLLHLCCPLLTLCYRSKGKRLSCRQRCWLFCKGAIVFKIMMLILKLSILFAIMYMGISDSEPSIRIRDPPPKSIDSLSSTCPYAELGKSPRLNWVQKSLLNVKWFLTLPIILVQKVIGPQPRLGKEFEYYNCSLAVWSPEYIYSVWGIATNENLSREPREFWTRMSLYELRILHALLQRLTEQFDRENLTYFLYGETLFDAYRHHGMPRWGDSINIAVPFSLRERIKDTLGPLEKEGYLLSSGEQEWYFFSRASLPIRGFKHKWPHIEISFYGENLRQIWDKNYKFAYTRRYERKVIFPLTKRPFWNLWLYAPNNISAILDEQARTECTSPTHDHRLGQWIPRQQVKKLSCSYLYDRVPLVFRAIVKNREVEILRIGDRDLQNVIITH